MKVVIPFVLIFAGLAALIAMGVSQGGIPELQVEQVVAGEYPDREVKVHGFLESIQSSERPLRFKVRAKETDGLVIDVISDRTKPDTFQEDYDVAVQGHWDADKKHFVAEQIFTKCPSKYEAEAKEGIGSPEMAADEPAAPADTTN
jgi:cytochrome c-type biogenesis protein CcmE